MVIHETKGDKAFGVVNTILLTIVLLIFAYPMWFVVIASISNPDLINSGQVILWPKGIMWNGYQAVFRNDDIGRGYLNTIIYTTFGTLLDLVVTLPAAYALSRKDFVGRNVITKIFMITMFFGGGMIPSYLVVQRLGLLNNPMVMIILGATGMFDIIMCRTFFDSSIPGELQDAAQIDGCSNLQLFTKIVLPLSKPIIAVMVLMFAVTHWNSYFSAMLYITNSDLKPLQLVLQNILIQSAQMTKMLDTMPTDPGQVAAFQNTKQLVQFASIIVSSLPVMCLYPLVQKYFVKGLMIGSVKG